MRLPQLAHAFILSLLILPAGCCGENCCNKQCPAIEASYAGYTAAQQGEVLLYASATDTISISITHKTETAPYVYKGKSSLMKDCDESPCRIDNELIGIASQLRNGHDDFGMRLRAAEPEPGEAAIRCMDFQATFKYAPVPGNSRLQDTLLSSQLLGAHLYGQLYRVEIDTAMAPAQQIWRVYISPERGLVGFDDRLTGQLYTLQ